MTPSAVQAGFTQSCAVVEQTSKPIVDVQALRKQFPIFETRPHSLFFDNAATSQKPRAVIDAVRRFYEEECANAGRAVYSMSTRLTGKVEQSRAAVARLINAEPCDVAFTS